jgi:uncharacterized repeat protein (TIGR04052 family)
MIPIAGCPRRRRAAVVVALAVGGAVWAETIAAQAATSEIVVRFSAAVDSTPFACGRSYAGLGASRTTVTPTDLRVYVHDVRLLTPDGHEVALALTQDSLWQYRDVALLDFEDGTGPCANGNAETHTVVTGTVPPGEYNGVRFAVGVPFDLNHRDVATQPSPLSLTRMFWVWNAGYKFLRLDMKTAADTFWMVHLGSTTCTPNETRQTVPTACAHPNRPAIAIERFDPARDVVVFDVAALLREANLGANQPETAAGCMSGPDDRDCTPVFAALGLAHGDRLSGGQRTFRVRPAAAP